MESRERWITTLSGNVPDRIVQTDTAFWPDTIKRWHGEGLPEGLDPAKSHWAYLELMDYFEFDPLLMSTLFDASLQFERIVYEETDEYIVERNPDGVTCKSWKSHYATPVELDFAIKTFDDWRKHKGRLAVTKGRLTEDSFKFYEEAVERYDHFRVFVTTEPIWYILMTLGYENALTKMASEPEFIHNMMETYTDFSIGMMELGIQKTGGFDALWFFSDLCYKNGMLFSPKTYRELFMPYHRRIKKFCDEKDMFFILHCDGNVTNFIPLLIEAGFDCIQPLEARAGNDVRVLKGAFDNNIVFFGNINADVLANGTKEEIEHEVISKIETAKAGGGYIYHIDHSVPPTVSLENYRFARKLVKEHGNY